MKQFLAVLITAFSFLIMGQAFAATHSTFEKSIDSLNASLICAKEDKEKKKKKKEGESEEEPECE